MRREWIEMDDELKKARAVINGLPPCGGSGLKCKILEIGIQDHRLPPCGGSGLKYNIVQEILCGFFVSLHAEGVD